MPVQDYSWDQCLQYAAISDIGMRRSNNQDSHAEVLAGDIQTWLERGHVFVIADGMGAHAAGELASKMAADAVPHLYYKHQELSPPEAILAAIREANEQIHGRGEANADFRNMGTTCSVLLLLPQGALIAHVGDSRIYRLRGDKLQQLTFDHSLLWEMRAAGQLPSGNSQDYAIPKNVITRSLGPHPAVQVDLEGPFPVEVGDAFLLCSDGLTGRVENEELGALLATFEPAEAARSLVDLANLRGGHDNITVIVVRVTGKQITTRAVGAEPLTIGGQYQIERTTHPAVWIVMGVFFLAAILMALSNLPIVALISAVAGVLALAVGILQKFGVQHGSGVTLASGRRLGRGPHQRTNVQSSPQLLKKFLSDLEQGRQAARRMGSPTDWSSFDQACAEATSLADRHQFAAALDRIGKAAGLLVEQMRTQRNIWTGDRT